MNDTTLIPRGPAEVAKAIIYIALTALAVFRTAATDGITPAEWIAVGLAVVGLIPVYLLTGTAIKTVAAFTLAGGQALILAIGPALSLGVVSADAWVGVIFAAFAAIGVAVVPNKPTMARQEPGRFTNL